MNRTELTSAVATRAGLPHDVVAKVLDALAEEILHLAGSGGDLRWPGLLNIDVTERPARTGRNPRTGEPLAIPARRQVRIRPGTRLKSAVQ